MGVRSTDAPGLHGGLDDGEQRAALLGGGQRALRHLADHREHRAFHRLEHGLIGRARRIVQCGGPARAVNGFGSGQAPVEPAQDLRDDHRRSCPRAHQRAVRHAES